MVGAYLLNAMFRLGAIWIVCGLIWLTFYGMPQRFAAHLNETQL